MAYRRQLKPTQKQIQMLSDESIHLDDMRKVLGYSLVTIRRLRRNLGLPPRKGGRPAGEERIERVKRRCPHCKKLFRVKKTSPKKFCSRQCCNASDEHREAARKFDKSYMQTEAYRATLRDPETPKYARYRREVWRLTKRAYDRFKSEINPMDLPRGLCGVLGAHQLDHIISIREGYDKHLSPEKIAAKSNLQMLPWRENLRKGSKS